MLIEQNNPDRRKFLYYACFVSLALGLAAVFDRYLLHNQDAPDSTVSSVTLYGIFVFLGLMSAMLFSGEEGNGFYYLFSCKCHCLFRPLISAQTAETETATAQTALLVDSNPSLVSNYGSCN